MTSSALGASGGALSVGPEATLASSPGFVSETINVNIRACGARRANPPPLTAEKARRTELISEMLAPQDTRVWFAERRSSSEMLSLMGHSIIAEPPPEI